MRTPFILGLMILWLTISRAQLHLSATWKRMWHRGNSTIASKFDNFIMPPDTTQNLGTSNYMFCTEDEYVIGMLLRVDRRTAAKGLDRVGVYGIRFYCGNSTKYERKYNVSIESNATDLSYIGQHGAGPSKSTTTDPVDTGSKSMLCKYPSTAVGLQVRYQNGAKPMYGDRTGVNNLGLLCSDGQLLEGNGMQEGVWTNVSRCPPRQAICGFNANFFDYEPICRELPQSMCPHSFKLSPGQKWWGTNDAEGLVNMRVACCPVKSPLETCIPTETEDKVFSCTNLNSTGTVNCEFKLKTGVSNTTSTSNTTKEEKTISDEFGFTAEVGLPYFQTSIETKITKTDSTGYDWSKTSEDTWTQETESTVTVSASPGFRVSVYQARASCSFMTVRAREYSIRQFRISTNKERNGRTDYSYSEEAENDNDKLYREETIV